MASPVFGVNPCAIIVNLFDGSRQPLPANVEPLVTVRDGNQRNVYREFIKGGVFTLQGLPFANNFMDNYTVVASASGYEQAGFTPVRVSPAAPAVVDLMLLGKDAGYNFSQARWEKLKKEQPFIAQLLAAGAPSAAAARDRYTDLMENGAPVLACFFNLATAMSQIHLPSGTPLSYLRELIWDGTMQPDRFFAWAAKPLADQVRLAAAQGIFAPEPGTAVFHEGATASFKQIQFGEANVQLTFHENDTRVIDGQDCIKVEPDIDYYKDLGAHALLEVVANTITGTLTDPRQVYVLRWIAGRRAGVAEFNPPYTVT